MPKLMLIHPVSCSWEDNEGREDGPAARSELPSHPSDAENEEGVQQGVERERTAHDDASGHPAKPPSHEPVRCLC